jgi:hypothetical protein
MFSKVCIPPCVSACMHQKLNTQDLECYQITLTELVVWPLAVHGDERPLVLWPKAIHSEDCGGSCADPFAHGEGPCTIHRVTQPRSLALARGFNEDQWKSRELSDTSGKIIMWKFAFSNSRGV